MYNYGKNFPLVLLACHRCLWKRWRRA